LIPPFVRLDQYTAAMQHDSGYHLLFAHPELVEDLIRSFVDAPWVAELDFSTLERVNAKLHGPGLDRREGDMIYRVRRQAGGEVYLYLLLEFQSRRDPWMAVRVLVYVGLLYQHLIKEGRLTPAGRLPPVFPLVLYNGDARWRAATSVKPLLDVPPGSALWAYQPRMRYYLIEEHRFPQGKADSLVGLLFRLENCRTSEQLSALVDELLAALAEPSRQVLKRDIATWLCQVLIPTKAVDVDTAKLADLAEVRTMLAERIEQWKKEWKEEGLQKGREEGREEGRSQGQAALLARQLERKFGPLPTAFQRRLAGAAPAELERWGVQLLDAQRLEDVFK
ncbi:MAG: Rpn family recombination-promoting nuclease/putative transposase, partial [Nitrococcus sp.]|nr:Rpn family recombination-promoting nuclease/putative transposase [Nitrococcus sp.]